MIPHRQPGTPGTPAFSRAQSTPTLKIPGKRRNGFALVVTVSLMVLLAVVAIGLLSLSAVQLRSSAQGSDRAVAMANARLGMLMALGELQKNLGSDKAVTAPAGILDTSPDTPELDGVENPYLTGVWQSRSENLGTDPDYDRSTPFKRWLVSNSSDTELEKLDFVQSGSLDNEVVMANIGSQASSDGKIQAGRVSLEDGAYAWWVGDENCKARINTSNDLERDDDARVGDLMAGFASPGPYGVNALAEFESFPANTEDTDKLITRDLLALIPDSTDKPADYFQHLTPYSQSVLANVTNGSLRKDLNLYLERTDIDWLEKWGRAEGVSRFPSNPRGPNNTICLSNPNKYDVLCWKTLHHWYNMHRRQLKAGSNLPLAALDNTTSRIDAISNPGWNTGVMRPAPVMARMQMLMSYGVKKKGKDAATGKNKYQLSMYSYPVVTMWNPYNVGLTVPGWSIFLHTMPLEHTIKVNGKLFHPHNSLKEPTYRWEWPHGNMVMRIGNGINGNSITFKPGEAKLLTYNRSISGEFHAHDMVARFLPWRPPGNVGHERDLGEIIGLDTDRITIETKAASWETSGTSYTGQNFQTTFGFRLEPRAVHRGHPTRMQQQMFSGQVCWRREASNPHPDVLSENNFPSKTLREIDNAPTPFVHLDVRLKTLDEIDLPNKTWLHNIPSHPYAAATSTAKHGSRGVDSATSFFAHPYTMSFEQKTTVAGLFQNKPFIGASNSPSGLGTIASQEIPMAPLSSLAQLQHLPQYPLEGLNWSGYYFQNHAIGNSYALPALPSDEIKERSFPFYLGEYFAWQGGDLTGKQYSDVTAFNNANYIIRNSPASVIDRSYSANHLLFDEYFFSSMAGREGVFFKSNGGSKELREVVEDFYNGSEALPNECYEPYFSSSTDTDDVVDALVSGSGKVTDDAHRKAASHLLTKGGFNINSTSVEAWTVMLAASHLKRPVTMTSGRPRSQDRAKFVVSRFSMPIGGSADNSSANSAEENRWLGYRELTADDIHQLATAVVEQVKKRGPFRSLGEFVNRRLSSDKDMALYGALQAALEDPDVEINKNYRDQEITSSDIDGSDYKFPEAALGSRFQGTPAYISQADLLMPLAPAINARSDTFMIRGYGEARAADGKTVTARAWCEAVVQRVPDYVDSKDLPETEFDSLTSEINKTFGRRFLVKTFRWLSPEEVQNSSTTA